MGGRAAPPATPRQPCLPPTPCCCCCTHASPGNMAPALHAACLPPRVWVVAVLVVAGVAVMGADRVPEGRPSLLQSVGRAGANLYHSTMHYLMDKLAPAAPPVDRADRRGRPRLKKPPRRPKKLRSEALEHECLGAVYRRAGGGSQCVGALTAALVVGLALAVQVVFYVAVGSVCPGLGSSLAQGRNVTSVVNIAVTNGVNMETLQEDMTQMQTQQLDQTQDQDLDQDIYQDVENDPVANVDQILNQDQKLNQTQTFTNNGRALALAHALARAITHLWHRPASPSPRAWPLPYLNLCPALTLYLTR